MRTPLVLFCLLTAACGKEYVRGSEVAGIDDPAMSTGLDRRDLQQLLHENMKHFLASPVANEWTGRPTKPQIAIFPFQNETSEHVDSQLQALLSDTETYFVNNPSLALVISRERQEQMVLEVERQHGSTAFNPAHVADYGRQLGVEFVITGKVYSSDERTAEGRRMQYFLFMQCIDVATSAIRWQNKAEITKAFIDT
jgi:hypothetical protein